MAFIDGYRFGNASPISGRLFDRFVCIRHSFPSNYSWSYVIQSCSKDDSEAFKMIEDTITEFVQLKEKLSDDEIMEFVASQMEEEGEAEKAFREFERALLVGTEELIKPLVEDHKDASILWKGAYSSEISTKLESVSSSHPVKCIPILEEPNKVNIIAQGWPFPIEMNFANGRWMINAEKIIEFRKTNNGA
ncbi:hypothetical protein [Pontibacter sp. G13]|uniref:hypothetical protein n=1 Tax=Pontibacter sp. G13 TaxID=3074898 RepID=UPI00288B9255|nr:hypothetical protein [Pontibacter sp. G13]WNJ17895.1 hypothetical protein RJD25_23830 [Pontibacter sp. G13]